MISVRVQITCDGCGGEFEGVFYESAAHAREAVEKAGWKIHKLYSRFFEFCQVCQREGVQAKAASG